MLIIPFDQQKRILDQNNRNQYTCNHHTQTKQCIIDDIQIIGLSLNNQHGDRWSTAHSKNQRIKYRARYILLHPTNSMCI